MIQAKKEIERLRGVDLFCGAGGMTHGAATSGRVDMLLAVNHWRTAIQSHRANHPDVRHICARMEDMNLADEHDLPEFDLLMAGIECIYHSVARGAKPINDQRRASAWRVIDWLEAKRPRWFVFENVREFLDWGPIDEAGRKIKAAKGKIFQAWRAAIEALGYTLDYRVLNAADFGEATCRRRLFMVGRLGPGSIPWPEPTHADPREILKALARGEFCTKLPWRTAAEIIDWSKPCPSIFGRKRPLAEKTLRRIEIGLKKFVGPFVVKMRGTATVGSVDDPAPTVTGGGTHLGLAQPFIVPYHGGTDPKRDGTERAQPIDQPLGTLDTQPRYGLAQPFMIDIHNGHRAAESGVDQPMPTITSVHGKALVAPFLVPNFGERDGQEPRTHSIDDPLTTVTGHGAGAVAVPFVYQLMGRGTGRSRDVREPLPTIIAARENYGLITAFLTKYYGTGGAESVEEPLSTITAKHRHGLTLVQTMQELGVVDIGFRMLDVDELKRAQGFPDYYELHGNKADQIRQIGNAVCPGVMRAICGALTEA